MSDEEIEQTQKPRWFGNPESGQNVRSDDSARVSVIGARVSEFLRPIHEMDVKSILRKTSHGFFKNGLWKAKK
jgi:hypothetical protein